MLNGGVRIFVLCMAGLAVAVSGMCRTNVTWLEKDYDFGLMKEIMGPKTGFARFVNNGPDEVIVLEARPSCGCTDSSVPEDPVMPGDTATITFTYDPAGRPGRFEKSVRVKFADNSREVIKIRGNVLGTPESLAQFYPVVAGSMRLSDTEVMAGRITQGKTSTVFVNTYNTLPDSVTLRVRTSNPALSVRLSDPHPGPGDISTIGFYFNSANWNEPGPIDIPVQLIAKVAGREEDPVILHFRGDVDAAVRNVGAKELANAPRFVGAPPVVDLGLCDPNVKGDRDIRLSLLNDGKSNLVVNRVWCDNPAVKIKKFSDKIKPGKSGRVELGFDPSVLTKVKSGPFRIEVKVSSNDPVTPVATFTLVGTTE